jgi:hypothetical protein
MTGPQGPQRHERRQRQPVFFEIYFVRLSGYSFNYLESPSERAIEWQCAFHL